jgi:hypothetical protein
LLTTKAVYLQHQTFSGVLCNAEIAWTLVHLISATFFLCREGWIIVFFIVHQTVLPNLLGLYPCIKKDFANSLAKT